MYIFFKKHIQFLIEKNYSKKFGATDCLNPRTLPEGQSIQSYLIENFDGGFDYTFECCGNVETMRQALESAHKGWGVSCVVGVAGAGEEIRTRPFQLITGRVWKGTSLGVGIAAMIYLFLFKNALMEKLNWMSLLLIAFLLTKLMMLLTVCILLLNVYDVLFPLGSKKKNFFLIKKNQIYL
uniref:Alcohol dehydrogenase-like C-terminal domain-containing protein n=1 Tax=Meloidogyne enterolobii TaxID=390850 RepID=A0A6V7UF33_MELEN|nr:unnamed protein product [Meloidogyne enterolobii]